MASDDQTTKRRSARGRRGRRTFIRAVGGISVAGLLAGCTDNGDGGNTEVDYGEYVDENEEPDYGGWFGDVDNYEGTIDGHGEERVEVAVGAEGGYSFGPPAVLIDPGTEVVWEWTGDGGQHNVVHVDGEFESERTQEEGNTFTHTFDELKVYRYVCQPHESMGMKGAITVREMG